jgi:hypothetical protein
MSYTRDLPRDLFNVSKLLKCLGQGGPALNPKGNMPVYNDRWKERRDRRIEKRLKHRKDRRTTKDKLEREEFDQIDSPRMFLSYEVTMNGRS